MSTGLQVYNGPFQPILNFAQKGPKLTAQPGRTRARAKQSTLCTSTKNSLKAICNLVPLDSVASWRHGVAKWGHIARIEKIGLLGRLARVASIHGP